MRTLDARVAEAVRAFWGVRRKQAQTQGSGTRKDQGERKAVTGGAHIDGFIRLVGDLLLEAGLGDAALYAKTRGSTASTKLPGFFRATKDWDLLVVADGELVASMEFKSQVGPSFGNNCNNRVEEALGNATDLWTAYREGAFRPSSRPWLGYFMLLEEAPGSTSPVKTPEPHFKVLPEFRDASYARRYELLCLKLVRERLYDAACLMLTNRRNGPRGHYTEPNPEIGFRTLVASLTARAIAFARSRS